MATAPSTPRKTQSVTLITLTIWLYTSPPLNAPSAVPQKLLMKIRGSNFMAKMMANSATKIGTILAIVVTILTEAASFTPRVTRNQQIQTMMEAPIMDGRLFPSPKTGKKYPIAANRSTV